MEKEVVLYEGEDDDSKVIIADDIERNNFHRNVGVINSVGDEGYLFFNRKKEITGIFSIKDDYLQRIEKEEWMRNYFPSIRCVMTKDFMQKWLPPNFKDLPVNLELTSKKSVFE